VGDYGEWRLFGSALKAAALVGALMMAGVATPAAGASNADARLKQAAQHFADLEDGEAKVILEELSAQGVAEADVLLGYLFSDPLYEGRDYEAAVAAFEQAATAGDEEGIFQLAESRFWPNYSDWTLTPDEKAVRLSAEDAFGLLLRAVGDGPHKFGDSGAPRWRLAWLCTFGGYDCGKEVTDEAVRKGGQQIGNLRMIANAFQIVDVVRTSEGDTSEDSRRTQAFLALGLAAADPFVGSLAAETTWRDLGRGGACPEPLFLNTAGRLLALEGNAVVGPEGWRDFRRCFDAEKEAVVREVLAASLDKLIRAHSNENAWHLYTCYQAPEAATFGDCLIHAVRDHYFACTKLSLIDYLRIRYEIDDTASARYKRCREAVIEARQG